MTENEKKMLVLMLLLRVTKHGGDCRMEEYVKTELGLTDDDFDAAKDSLQKAELVHYQCGNSDSCCPFSFTVKGAKIARKVLIEQLFH